MLRTTLLASMIAMLCACSGESQAPAADATEQAAAATAVPPVTSLLGTQLNAPEPIPNAEKLEADLAEAKATLDANPDDPEALIWYGRRQAYLWRYADAIETFTQGIERWPENAKFYRHRGHRYVTTRQFALAQADFEKAAQLIAGTQDEIEPDGVPNRANQPRTTLAYNIWYHLGLSHFLQGNFEAALAAYDELLKLDAANNNDAVVAVQDWRWMSLMRLGRKDEAAAILEHITPGMELLENDSYLRRLLMYKGVETPDALLNLESDDTTDLATQGYGVANYYLVNGETDKAKAVLEKILAGAGWNAFGYIAAEADMARLK